LQIFAAAFFLFYVQLRGVFGYALQPTSERYKSDALGFYMEDIWWFNLIFVTLAIHALSFHSNIAASATAEPGKLGYSALMFATRLLQLYFLLPLKDSKRQYRAVSHKVWIFFAVVELIGVGITLSFSHYRGITAATSLVEVSVFLGQYAYWWLCARGQGAVDDDQGGSGAELADEIRSSLEAAKLLLDKPKRDYCVEDSIYNFAVYSLIHPDVIKSWPQNEGYATGITLSLNERESVFQGAVALVFIQVTMISLVMWEMYASVKILPPESFSILIPRVIASFFMHANLQGEIKNGLRTMKYVVGHPYSFRKFDPGRDDDDEPEETDEEDKNDGLYIRVFYAFMLGFIQTMIGLVLEAMSILYLCSKDSFRLILMSYATMASIASFDDLYSKSLLEHPIREIIGKKICTVYRRSMHFQGATIAKAIEHQKQAKTVSSARE